MTLEGGLDASVNEDIVTGGCRMADVGVAWGPGMKGRRAVGKGDSDCSKGEGCAHCLGMGVLFVFVFLGERET